MWILWTFNVSLKKRPQQCTISSQAIKSQTRSQSKLASSAIVLHRPARVQILNESLSNIQTREAEERAIWISGLRRPFLSRLLVSSLISRKLHPKEDRKRREQRPWAVLERVYDQRWRHWAALWTVFVLLWPESKPKSLALWLQRKWMSVRCSWWDRRRRCATESPDEVGWIELRRILLNVQEWPNQPVNTLS